MDQTLADACLAGLELNGAGYAAAPVDLAAPYPGGVLIAWGGWWRQPVPSAGEDYRAFDAVLAPGAAPGTWVLTSLDGMQRAYLSGAADGDGAVVLAALAADRRANRNVYLAALHALAGGLPPGATVDPLIDTVLRLPPYDPLAAVLEMVAGSRRVARMHLVDAGGRRVDTLVTDGTTAATATGTTWLSQMAAALTESRIVRYTPERALDALLSARPYGPYAWAPGAAVVEAAGTLDQIARQEHSAA